MSTQLASRLVERSLARPRRALAGLGLLTLAAVPGLFRLELRTDGHALIPPKAPEVAIDREIRAHFDLRDPIVVLLETEAPEGVWRPETLRRLVSIGERLAALPEIGREHVVSLATLPRLRIDRRTGDFATYLDPFPATSEEIAEVRDELVRTGLYEGLLISRDHRATILLAGVAEHAAGTDRAALWKRVDALVAGFAAPGETLHVVGAPAAEALLGRHVLEDLGQLLPVALAMVALALGFATRRFAPVALGFAKVGACLLFTFGVMGWVGSPVYLTTAVLPLILATVGLADEIHLLLTYQGLLARLAPAVALPRTFEELVRPIVWTSFTTAFGFGSFLTAEIRAISAFGAFAALGVLYCLAWSLVATPALLVSLPAERFRRPALGHGSAQRFAGWLERRRSPALAILGLATLGLGAGILRLEVQDSWLSGFAAGSEFRRGTERLDQRLAGSHLLLVHASIVGEPRSSPRDPGVFCAPTVANAVADLEDFLAARPEVGGIAGPVRTLTAIRALSSGGQEDERKLYERADWNSLLVGRFEWVAGAQSRRRFLDDDRRRLVISAYLKDANYRDTQNLFVQLRRFEAERLAPLGVKLDFAGDVALSQVMIPAIVRGQVGSLALSLLAAAAALTLLLRSPGRAALAIAPAVLAVVWVFGAMGWGGLPLGVATSMFCALSLGIGVDYAIHLLARFELARDEGVAEPARTALAAASPAILVDCLAIAVGFGLLAFSQVPANRAFGLLVVAALGACCVLTLLGLGGVLFLRISRSEIP